MIRTGTAVLFPALFLCLVLPGAAQEKDRIGKDKAPTVLKKALAEIQKKKGAAISEVSEVAAGRQKQKSEFEGVQKKDFAAVKGGAEVYARGAVYLVNLGGRFDPPDQMEGPEAAQAQSFRNPSLLIDELGKIGSPPQFGPDESVDGKDCKVVDVAADPATLKMHLKEFGERLNRVFKNQLGFAGAQVFDMKNSLDEKNSAASYHVCIGKDDLLIYRIDFVLRPKVKPGSLPPRMALPDDLDTKVDVKFSKWDEENPVELPAVIKAKWGMK
jgi:hypothetical protein